MTDIVLDSNILADVIAQYYEAGFERFNAVSFITKAQATFLNRILNRYKYDGVPDDEISFGLVIASTLGFVEIARKFDVIVSGRFTVSQFRAFIVQPPEWFLVASIDETLLPYLVDLPAEVITARNAVLPLEWADAIHVATTLSRDKCVLATSDRTIQQIATFQEYLI